MGLKRLLWCYRNSSSTDRIADPPLFDLRWGFLHVDYPAELSNLFFHHSSLYPPFLLGSGLGFGFFSKMSSFASVCFGFWVFLFGVSVFFFYCLLHICLVWFEERGKRVAMMITSSLFWNESWGKSLAESNLLLQ